MTEKKLDPRRIGFRLFTTMFQVGCIGFGGGNALIPVLHRKTVEEQKLLTDEEYEEDVLIASVTPGALPVEIAGGIGHRILGWKGTLIGAYGMALPGVILTLIFLLLFEIVNETTFRQITFMSVGISAFICILLMGYVKGTFQSKTGNRTNSDEKRKRIYSLLIMLTVFLLTCGKNLYRIFGIAHVPVFGLATIDIFILAFFLILTNAGGINIIRITVSVVLGILFIAFKGQGIPWDSDMGRTILYAGMILMSVIGICTFPEKKKSFNISIRKQGRIKDIVALFVVVIALLIPALFIANKSIVFAGKGILSSIISFGGGDAYLTVADGLFVSSGMISEKVFYGNIVPVVNILPGSILCKTLSGIGFYIGTESTGSIIGGIIVSLLGFSLSVFASCGIFSLIYIFYSRVSEEPAFVMIKEWIRPIVSGLMFTVILSLIYQTQKIGSGWISVGYVAVMAVLFIVGYILYNRKWSNIRIIGILATGSLVLCNLVSFLA